MKAQYFQLGEGAFVGAYSVIEAIDEYAVKQRHFPKTWLQLHVNGHIELLEIYRQQRIDSATITSWRRCDDQHIPAHRATTRSLFVS